MKKSWRDPVKNQPASETTLNMTADFQNFTELMKRVINVKPTEEKPEKIRSSASPSPAVS
jgi:hypothetical protein